ncbi:N-acetylneuraminate synthase family protein [Dechloromonas denitrificans]|uniref:N-acetylneuraminate synthase family protein n=1 Tax=Dechloromonas denitrificans TaxID=281362 RepID=UPI001CF8F3D0|nr:N-acetylneuraminate synthase family protein [Dechloromonas denitrificans]UCV02384.1 N-acetylneuraminate synthase family protein [Dechloromonas denitrificans]
MNNELLEQCQNRGWPLIIAEIGANYGGMEIVKAMVRAAAACGVDLVKFQTYRAETIATPGSFFTFEDGSQVSQFDFFKKHELSEQDHDELDALCRQLGIQWLSTPSHVTDLALLEKYELPFYKTGSDDLTNLPFLKAVASKGRPMLVSTGMCSLAEIEMAVDAIQAAGNQQLILLHCVVSYPSKVEDANLRVIETLQRAFGLPVGLSDHTQDEFTSVLATQMGAVVIEKHLTLDHALKLPDHEASLDPVQFRLLVDRVRLVNRALGNGIKSILPTEQKWRQAARKSLFSATDIAAGTILEESHIAIRRPSDGIHPQHLPLLLGRPTKTFIAANTLIQWDML